MARLVVVGAGLAGLRAAQAARGAGFAGEVVVVGAEPHMPYTRPPLSKAALTGAESLEDGAFPVPEDLDADWRLGAPVTALDTAARTVTVGGEPLAYDHLVVATGCRPRTWPGPGADLDGLHTLRDREDAVALRAALEGARRLVVVGAGFVGCEVAASARALGVEVTLLDVATHPMPALGPLLGERCAALHREHGVDLRLGGAITAITGDGRADGVQLADGTHVAADVVLVALGAVPDTGWLEGSGLDVADGVRCDATLAAVGAEDVFCAGDVARWPHPLADGETLRVEHWTNAAEQGTVAGRNAVVAPSERREHVAVPSFWSDQYDVKLQAVGLPRAAVCDRVVETDGHRLVAIGADGDRVLAAVGLDAARRLPAYRRHIAAGASPAAVDEALAADPKALGVPA